jgi:SSS family solute:Na+ symporter
VIRINIHFVHVWGIEFLLNMAIMFAVSWFFPGKQTKQPESTVNVELTSWKYTGLVSVILVIITICVYVALSN